MILHLTRENKLTEDGLKELYRKLSKETHPDLKGGDGESFRRLKDLYEEALSIIREDKFKSKINEAVQNPPGKRESEQKLSREELRYKILKTFYIYSVKFRGQYSEGLLDSLIETARQYSEPLYEILLLYRETIFIPFIRIKRDADVYWTHGILISLLPQLASYFNYSSIMNKRLCRSYIKELKDRAGKLPDGDYQRIFHFLADWLEEEMQGEKVIIIS